MKMDYYKILNDISTDNRFSVYQSYYDDKYFGNYFIRVGFDEKLDLEITQDRGIIEIVILYTKLFFQTRIPLKFCIEYVRSPDELCKNYSFDNIVDAQSYLIENIKDLEIISKNNLMNKVKRKWKNSIY